MRRLYVLDVSKYDVPHVWMEQKPLEGMCVRLAIDLTRPLSFGSTAEAILEWLHERNIAVKRLEFPEFSHDYEFLLTEHEEFEFRTRWF